MSEKRKIAAGILQIAAALAIIQLLRFGITSVFFIFVERTNFSDRVASAAAMTLLTGAVLLIAHRKKIILRIFPIKFNWVYIAATAAVAALMILTPAVTRDYSATSIFLLLYSAVVVPVFEEIIFRSLVWNRLETLLKNQWIVYIIDAVLFALWHFGYVDSLLLRVESGLPTIMIWKAVTGLFFGIVLGAVRMKTKNSYSTMLLHGAMNILAR